MPELPEVETVVAGLRRRLLGRRLTGLTVRDRTVVKETPRRLLRAVGGRRLISLGRRGKLIVFQLSSGARVIVHLKMTGRLLFDPAGEEAARARVRFVFDDGTPELFFVDRRRFGYLSVLAGATGSGGSLLDRLGPDALTVGRKELAAILSRSRRPVKALLLDQERIAGLGNIYVDECLHRAGIHPRSPASAIPGAGVRALHRALQRTLAAAIRCGGSSVSSFCGVDGEKGRYQRYHRVYGRRGRPCRRCGTAVEYTRLASRGTHYCPVCQPE